MSIHRVQMSSHDKNVRTLLKQRAHCLRRSMSARTEKDPSVRPLRKLYNILFTVDVSLFHRCWGVLLRELMVLTVTIRIICNKHDYNDHNKNFRTMIIIIVVILFRYIVSQYTEVSKATATELSWGMHQYKRCRHRLPRTTIYLYIVIVTVEQADVVKPPNYPPHQNAVILFGAPGRLLRTR